MGKTRKRQRIVLDAIVGRANGDRVRRAPWFCCVLVRVSHMPSLASRGTRARAFLKSLEFFLLAQRAKSSLCMCVCVFFFLVYFNLDK